MIFYAGIGSRSISEKIRDEFISIGKYLAEEGYTLRSGGATGADSAFEKGCDLSSGYKEIFLPWKGFNDNQSNLFLTSKNKDVFEIASKVYPGWSYAKDSVKRLHARNVQQVLGEIPDFSKSSSFVVCWSNRDETEFRGTMFAVELAKRNYIPIYNFFKEEDRNNFYKTILKNF